ncbi:MAG: hypothetical protein JRN52_06105 [Nitrososphaerota archaeon]|nr:hypothetical protein [Nitrososphaerota archaeon]
MSARDLRGFAAIPLSVYLVVAGVAMWFFNPISQQNQFAALLGSEFFTIAMLLYVYMHEDFGHLAVLWFSMWLFAMAIMLSLAFV